MKPIPAMLLCALTLGVAPSGSAHHSGAMFDRARTTTITGTVTEFNWTNPHSSFKVDVADSAGTVQTWAIEMNSPNNLVREGWKRSTIKAGDKVTVALNPLRDGKPGGWYVAITLPDGRRLTSTEPGTAAK